MKLGKKGLKALKFTHILFAVMWAGGAMAMITLMTL